MLRVRDRARNSDIHDDVSNFMHSLKVTGLLHMERKWTHTEHKEWSQRATPTCIAHSYARMYTANARTHTMHRSAAGLTGKCSL